MRKKILPSILTCAAAATAVADFNFNALHPDTQLDAMRHIQYSDFAGIGTISSASNHVLVVSDPTFWVGHAPGNPLEIRGVYFYEGWDETNLLQDCLGKPVVFFAMTNEWKSATTNAATNEFDWRLPERFDKFGAACPPKFNDEQCPTWFVIETSGAANVAFLSNIAHSVFISRDIMAFYAALRDAVKPDESGENPYNQMSRLPLLGITNDATEAELAAMLHDAKLAPRYRRRANWMLHHRFDWPATNTVPVP